MGTFSAGRTPFRSRGPRVVGFLVAALLSVGFLGAPPTLGSPHLGPAHPVGPLVHPEVRAATVHPQLRVVSQQLVGTSDVFALGSTGATALTAVSLPNLSLELVLSNLKSNTSRVLGVVPGGFAVTPQSVTAAGGKFFVALLNSTTLAESYDQVTVAGKVTSVAPPLRSSLSWTFPYGNSTALVAAAEGALLVLNPGTLTVTANYSSAVPSGFFPEDLLPSGSLWYLAGSLFGSPSSHVSPWFGVLNTSTGVATRISSLHYFASPQSGAYYALAAAGGDIYVGGGVESFSSTPFDVQTVRGFLYRYSPATGAFTNRSALLPTHNETVFSLEPWRTSVLVNLEGFQFTANGTWEAGGLYLLNSLGTKLTNKSSWLPSGFFVDFFEVTSESGGYVMLGGSNTSSGLAQVVGLRP